MKSIENLKNLIMDAVLSCKSSSSEIIASVEAGLSAEELQSPSLGVDFLLAIGSLQEEDRLEYDEKLQGWYPVEI